MNHEVLTLQDVSAQVGGFVLNDINLRLEAGTITGLIGRNGMGKTTLLKAILGVLPEVQGDIRFWGESMAENEAAIKQKTGVVFDGLAYPARMSLYGLAGLYGPLYDNFDPLRMKKLCSRMDVDPAKKLGALSKGMQMKALFIFALAHHPSLILLDEPTAGLDPAARMDLLDLLYETVETENAAVLFSTHITTDLDKAADYITLMKNGRLQFFKEKDSLLDDMVLATFDPAHLDEEKSSLLLGHHRSKLGTDGILQRAQLEPFGIAQRTARPTLDDIICYMG